MDECRVYNFIDKKFKIFHKRSYLVSVSILIPLIGFGLDITKITETAFERSGAVMVAFAIASVFINHYVGKEIEHARGVYQQASPLGTTVEEIEKKLNPALKQNRMATARTLHALVANAQQDLGSLIKIQSNIVVIEFMCGFFGTLIWGFGDLLA